VLLSLVPAGCPDGNAEALARAMQAVDLSRELRALTAAAQ
jgi:hypothetical protein